MKWIGMYFLGYLVVLGGLLAALWKLGVVEQVGPEWIAIGLVIALGIGIMAAVSAGGGDKRTIEIDHSDY
jgi:hypothetical protein